MSNKRTIRGVSQTRKPVNECSAEELHAELVSDFVRNVHTPLHRFLLAVERIAVLRGHKTQQGKPDTERVYRDVRAEAQTMNRIRGMFG